MAVQYLQVFLRLRIVNIFLFEQIDIIDDGGERRFDVVGNIGDQLGFHALAAQTLVYGTLHALLHFIQVLAAPLQIAPQKARIHRLAVIALRQCLGTALQGSKSDGNIQCKHHQQQIQQNHRQRQHRIVTADDKDKQAYGSNHQCRPPDQRNGAYQMKEPAPYAFDDSPQQLNGIPDDIVLQNRSCLAAGDKGDDKQINKTENSCSPQRLQQAGTV